MSRELVETGREFESKIAHSAGVVAEGRFLFTSGITSRDDVGNVVGAGDMAAQVGQVFANLENVLAQVGADFSRVVKFTIYVTDIDGYRDARASAPPFMTGAPASTLIEVSRLASPDLLVEVEAIVALD
jgi:enamine deaminase RidA (YjgF/YER057c/UK114 family)